MASQSERQIKRLVGGLVLAAAYWMAAKAGLAEAFVQANATAVWPPTGIAIAALLIWGWRLWPGVFLGAFCSNLFTYGTVATSLGIATGNSLEALAAYAMITALAGGRRALQGSANVMKFAVLGGLLAPIVGASVGVGVLSLAGMVVSGSLKETWLTWWIGDAGGVLLVAPLLLLWPESIPRKIPMERLIEGLALVAALGLTVWIVMGGGTPLSTGHYAVQSLFIPLLLWAAYRFGAFPVVVATLVVSVCSIEGTLQGWGPFHGTTPNQSLLLLQGFMCVTMVTVLTLAAGMEERRRSEEGLRWSESELKLKVMERTEELQKANFMLGREIRYKETLAHELSNSEKYFRALIENALDIVTILDERGVILFESPSISRLLGYEVAELNGVNAFSLMHPEDQPHVEEAFAGILEGPGNIRTARFRFRHKDGSWRVLESIGTNLLGDEAIQGIVINSRDITSEVEALETLQEREERLRLLVENIQDYALFLLDPHGRVMTWNDGAHRMKGYTAPEAIGQSYSSFYAPSDVEKGRPEKLLEEAALNGRAEEEGWRMRKDGSRFWGNTVLTALRDGKGEARGFVLITRDITHRKRMEELAQSNHDLEQFAYVASHDLQEPLRMVTSFVQLFAQKYKGKVDEQADQYIHLVVDGAARMRSLIMDLLAYSRVDSAKEPFGRVDCSKALEQARYNLAATLRENRAEIICDHLPEVNGDFNQITQLFQNLLANAVKFHGSASPRVRVEAREQDGQWLFSVQDNGIDLDPRYSDQIFEIFKRLHDRSRYPGTGIGLAICKRVVTRHGGRIWVESQPEKGATFYWTLPISEEAAIATETHS